jgi:hypothetical protein
MLSITKQSDNSVNIVGVLKERNVEEKVSQSGKAYVRGTAIISTVTQVDGKAVESDHKIEKMVFKLKKDGSENKLYDAVKDWEKLVSVASATDQVPASRVCLQSSSLEENMFLPNGKDTVKDVKSTTKINVGWLKPSNDENDKSEYTLTGVVVKDPIEQEKNGELTGNLVLKVGVFGYCNEKENPDGNISILDLLVTTPLGINWVRSNVKEGDTILVQGDIINSFKKVVTVDTEGFGEISKESTVSIKEYRVRAAKVLDEENSYDYSDVKRAMAARMAKKEDVVAKAKERAANSAASASAKSGLNDFGMDDAVPF